jgi:hypothetical protein
LNLTQFDRDGEAPQQQLVLSGGGRKALFVAMTTPLQREVLQVGDRLTVRDPGEAIPRHAD